MKPTNVLIIGAALLGTGCAKSVIPLYEAAREAALAKPGAVASNWKPDAVLTLSPGTLNPIVKALLQEHGTLTERIDLKVGTITPRLHVKKLTLGAAGDCSECIGVEAKLDGSVAWKTPIAKGKETAKANIAFDAMVEVVEEGGSFSVRMAPRNLRDVRVTVAGKSLSYAEAPIEKWVDSKLLDSIPAQPIAKLGSSELPLRAVRAIGGEGIVLMLLTSSPSPKPLRVEVDELAALGDWQLVISTDSLTDLAAAAAFENGEVGYSVVPVPTAISFNDGDEFTLDLRLWRTKGKGWWRDYQVTGTTRITDKGLKLKPQSVSEAGQSKGANFVDPLAMIGEGVILKTIEQALTTTLPTDHGSKVGGVATSVVITDVSPLSAGVSVSGDLVLKGGKAGNRGQKKGKR